MYGTIYSNHPEILINSFQDTSSEYRTKNNLSKFKLLIKLYITLFGIPEIGFQMRAKYFFSTLKQMEKINPKKILDAGCGIGYYSFSLAKKYPKAEILAVDLDEEKLSFCKSYANGKEIKNITFIKADIEKFLKNKSDLDLIINVDVLEHIKNYRKVLVKFYKMLKPGGYLYIHTPKDKQERIFKKFFSNWHHEDHVREGFTPEELKKDLEKIGFKSVAYSEGFGFWGKLAWELNHIALSKNFILAGTLFPIIYFLSKLDSGNNQNGLSAIILARK